MNVSIFAYNGQQTDGTVRFEFKRAYVSIASVTGCLAIFNKKGENITQNWRSGANYVYDPQLAEVISALGWVADHLDGPTPEEINKAKDEIIKEMQTISARYDELSTKLQTFPKDH